MGPPFDKVERLQAIENATEGDRLDFKQISKRALLNTFVPSEGRKHLPLRPGQVQAGAACALFEALPQEPRDVVQEEPECRVRGVHARQGPALL
jgi:hypothetical protein